MCLTLGLVAPAAGTNPGVNGQLLVWGGRGDSYGLYLTDLESGALTRLPIEDTAGVGDLAWSPDGSQLAFTRTLPPHESGRDLWLFDVATATWDLIRQADQHESFWAVTWSPAGDELFVVTDRHFLHPQGPAVTLLRVDRTGAIADEVELENLMAVMAMEWSPRGDELLLGLLGHLEDFTTKICLFDLDSHDMRCIAEGMRPDWSPDGSHIVFEPGNGGQLQIIDRNGVAAGDFDRPVPGSFPRWSPDGNSIAYVPLGGHFPDARLEVMNVDGTGGHAFVLGFSAIFDIFWQPIEPLSGFVDVPDSHIFAADVRWLAATGITAGCDPPVNLRFCPDRPTTRGEAAAMIVRAFSFRDQVDDLFRDDDDSIFESDINRLAAAGVTKGCNPPDNTNFCPNDNVTRGEMAAFLVRALGYTDDGGGNLFVDTGDSTFASDIDKLAVAGVTRGCNPPINNRFCPTAQVTRGQMAALLHRALG